MAHGSDEGLGAYMLRTFDDVSQISSSVKSGKTRMPRAFEFMLRKAPEGTRFPYEIER